VGDCHQDRDGQLGSDQVAGSQVAAAITDLATDHPDFAVPQHDDSGLKFSHAAHLSKEGIRSPSGRSPGSWRVTSSTTSRS